MGRSAEPILAARDERDPCYWLTVLAYSKVQAFSTLKICSMPGPRHQQTKGRLHCMNLSGATYFGGVLIYVCVMGFNTTLPAVVMDPESRMYYEWLGYWCIFSIVINFVLMKRNDSVYDDRKIHIKHRMLPDGNWKYCIDCDQAIPPRTHHCALCGKCILQRDHHCFFTGCCVGFSNQRYFIVYTFYCSLGCAYALYINWKYTLINFVHPVSGSFYNYFLPITILQWLFGYQSSHFVCVVLLLYICFTTSAGAGALCGWQILMVTMGTTSHEYNSCIRKQQMSFSGICRKFQSVFGWCWMLNFLIPLPCLKTPGNGLKGNLPHIV